VSTADAIENLTYDVFVNEWPQQTNGLLPNGEPKRFSPQARARGGRMPQFRTIQVCPKDRLTLPPAGSRCVKPPASGGP
jgi:hypothetical protein